MLYYTFAYADSYHYKCRRRSADNGLSVVGLSAERIERSSFKQRYSKVEDLEDKEATQCVICITGKEEVSSQDLQMCF